MRVIPINRRSHWQQHILNNAYQAEVLSDATQKYWVEALPQPFCIQFSTEEETILAQATEALGRMCQEYLDWFFTDHENGSVDRRLDSLKIKKAYWEAIKLSWDRTDPEDLSLYTRFDLIVPEQGSPLKMIEINGETPLLGCEQVYQWNWLQDMRSRRDTSLPADANQFNEFWDKVGKQLGYILEEYDMKGKVFSFLVDERLNEDKEMAAQLIQILQDLVDSQQYCQMIYLRDQLNDRGQLMQRGIGLDDRGYIVDHCNDRIFLLWKIYDWSDLQNDVENFGMTEIFAKRLEVGDVKCLEPLWKQVLSNKGSMVYLWEQFKEHPEYGQYLLETFFENDLGTEATRLILDTHVRKPLLGLEGVGTSIQTGLGSAVEERESFGYGQEGFIVQQYFPLPTAYDYHYMVGSWLVGGLGEGEAAGVIIRGDRSRITGRHCLIIPHIVSDREILVS
jgi:glutathionylspermidine synthase